MALALEFTFTIPTIINSCVFAVNHLLADTPDGRKDALYMPSPGDVKHKNFSISASTAPADGLRQRGVGAVELATAPGKLSTQRALQPLEGGL